MFDLPPVLGLNHVLTQQAWARQQLSGFAGRTIEFRAPPLPALRVTIRDDGLLKAADAAAQPDLSVLARATAMPLLMMRDEAAMRDIEITGSTELAQVVQRLFRNLEWDAEEDLSRVFGDVLARRIAGAGRGFFSWQREAGLRLAQNFAEYWTEEQPLIARRTDLERFNAEVDTLRDDAERLDKRLAILERRTPAG